MPRKRPKTAADRPVYRLGPARQLAVPDGGEQARRELIERRSRDMLDAWIANARPLASVTAPRLPSVTASSIRRSAHRYQRSLEEELDSLIRKQARARQLEDGLAVILEGDLDAWERSQFAEIVERAVAGETAEQIAEAVGEAVRTIERRLAEVREAAVKAEELAHTS